MVDSVKDNTISASISAIRITIEIILGTKFGYYAAGMEQSPGVLYGIFVPPAPVADPDNSELISLINSRNNLMNKWWTAYAEAIAEYSIINTPPAENPNKWAAMTQTLCSISAAPLDALSTEAEVFQLLVDNVLAVVPNSVTRPWQILTPTSLTAQYNVFWSGSTIDPLDPSTWGTFQHAAAYTSFWQQANWQFLLDPAREIWTNDRIKSVEGGFDETVAYAKGTLLKVGNAVFRARKNLEPNAQPNPVGAGDPDNWERVG